MRINLVFPYNRWGGAFRSTYELANRMADLGQDVQIYMPLLPYLEGTNPLTFSGLRHLGRSFVRNVVRWNRVPQFDIKVPVTIVPGLTDVFIRDADVIVANHWPTAFSVHKLSASKGRKYYYIRDTDPWSPAHHLELESFRLPLRRIVVASWLEAFLETKMGLDVAGVVTNGTNTKLFEVEQKEYRRPPVVCMMTAEHPSKGVPDGLAALARVKARHPEVPIVLFGWKRPKSLPFEAEFHERPVRERLRAIYANADIFLHPSLQEGYQNPPREAMCAECAVVMTNVGCAPHCTIPGETALVVEPADVQAMADAVSSLIQDPDRIPRLGRRALAHIRQFTWERSTAELLALFAADSARVPTSAERLSTVARTAS